MFNNLSSKLKILATVIAFLGNASALISGLFLAGEILDVDAFTGGFNLQIAWSTGALAGGSI